MALQSPTRSSTNSLLEKLWGLDTLPDTECTAWIPRPEGFIVAEPYQVVPAQEGWSLYLVRKEGLTTLEAARILVGEAGARRYTVYGLKDKNAIAYQYVSLYKPRRTPERVRLGKLEAWLIARRASPLQPGGHGRNIFRITLETRNRECAEIIVEKALATSFYPNYIGPQRFGVCKPDSHLQGLALTHSRLGEATLLENTGYLLGSRGETGKGTRGAWRTPHYSLTLQALQSYVFNRALSIAVGEGIELHRLSDKTIRLACPGEKARVPAAPLPGRGVGRNTLWGQIIERVLGEEGLSWETLAVLDSPLRSLLSRPCRKTVVVGPVEDQVMLVFSLPRGSYATVYLRHLVRLDWVRECSDFEREG